MAFGNFGGAEGMLDGIKSKLGFADNSQTSGYQRRSRNQNYDDEYEDDYDDLDDYDDYADDQASTDSRYDSYNSVTSRPASARSSSSSYGGYRPAKLVSIDDVRAHTTVPESLNRDPLPKRRTTPAFTGRVTVDAKSEDSAPTYGFPGKERSESLDSLFDSTADRASEVAEKSETTASAKSNASSFDPYKAYEGSSVAKHKPTRSLTIVKPTNYGECEQVAKALKAGDAVVLVLKATPAELVKRVLDFSFGASSALDASVDCVADKVFVIARGQGLTDSERSSLHDQGIL